MQRIKIDSFGAFSNKVVGPFGPHLNVVFGQNEAGKTTLASFVGGVLFGWEEARGSRNTYKPINAERAGSLFFVEDEGDGSQDERILSRVRNSDGLQGDASLVADIDKETFQTMFSLTSDELRTLRNTTDVTAKLLTAGSGTGASPAHALATVQERLAGYTSRAAGIEHSIANLTAHLAGYTSRAAGIEHSIANLTAQQSDLRARMAAAAEEAERFKRQDKEFRELEPQRNELLTRLDALNTDIETLAATRANIEKLDREIDSLTDQIASLHDEEDVLVTTYCAHTSGVSELAKLGTSDERALRDQIDSLAVDEAKCEHAVDLAQDNFATSKAAYEALLETADAQAQHERSRRQRGVQVALSIVLPLGFISAGLPLFIHGREITSLSFTAVGVGLIVFAIMLALAAMVMLFRPNKEEGAKEARKQDAQWVMLQDKKKLEACLESQEAFRVRARAQLDAAGLADANGSLRRSRTLLDEAKDARAENNLFQQRLQALVSRRSALEESLASAKRQRRRLYERIDLRSERTIEAVDDALAQKSQQRMGLLETSEGLNRRYGELKQELSHAEHLHDFDELKLLYQQVRTRQDESAQEYARLLLARRMLESAIATWESKSQPEVYRQASRLLSLMTDGRWTKVSLTAEGRLQVIDAVKTRATPCSCRSAHASSCTCRCASRCS
ncbi:ATP-binding protein [Eggerthella sinensis]|uniref:ATP-binding protein n=1 Tax=Eggerthella sinensis TaxID=242230 RepID=UPI0022E9717C|nr:AAA family ATPase [Eggerthella sinensis]